MPAYRLNRLVNYTALVSLSSLLMISCSKKEAVEESIPEYVQFFKASVNGKSMAVENTMQKDREILSGSWTGVGHGSGIETELYTVSAVLPNNDNAGQSAKIRLQIENIKVDTFQINNAAAAYSSIQGSHFRLLKGNSYYVPNNVAKPFHVRITKYERPAGSSIPTVGGQLNGVLYNEQNSQDSVVIKDGSFEVRF